MRHCVRRLTSSRAAPADKKGGGAPSTSTPLVRRAAAPGEGGTREAQPRFFFPQRMREIRVVPRPMRRFGEVPNHNGGGSAL